MNGERWRVPVLVVTLVCALAAGPALVAGETVCAAPDDRPICVDDGHLSATHLAEGETATIEATVQNRGDEPANATVVLNTVGPDGTTGSHVVGRVRLVPGETRTVVQPIRASTPGSHGLRLVAFDGDYSRRYDASAGGTLLVGSVGVGGPLDRTEYALGALVGSVGVVGGLGYREYHGDR